MQKNLGFRLGAVFGLTGAGLGLWFGLFGATASSQVLSVMRPVAGVFVVASFVLPVVMWGVSRGTGPR
jgi:hypothetical protein